MKNIDFEAFVKWQQEKPRRHVCIQMGQPDNSDKTTVWAYDYDLQIGQHVTSVEQINLEGKKAEEDFAEYKRLQAQFGQKLEAVG